MKSKQNITDDGDLNEERAKRNRYTLEGSEKEPDANKVANYYATIRADFSGE